MSKFMVKLGIAFVLAWFGITQLLHADASVPLSVFAIAIGEIVCGILLFTKKYAFGVCGAIVLFGLAIVMNAWSAIAVLNVGLLLCALSLLVHGETRGQSRHLLENYKSFLASAKRR